MEHALRLLDGQAATAPAAGATSQLASVTAPAPVRVPAQMDITPFAGHGDVVIGRAKSFGRLSDWFPGMIRDVEVFQQALSASQVKVLP